MTFFAFGYNHQTASVSLRERFALSPSALSRLYQSAPLSDEAELIVLSTCNRTEFYLFGTADDLKALRATIDTVTGESWEPESAFLVTDEAAIAHVLHVAGGLKSMIPGDAQILSQVKDAYRLAVEEDRVGTVLHRLMHTTFRAAKQIVNETTLTSGAASVPSMAAALARTHLEQLASHGYGSGRVLLVGAGQMGRLVLEALGQAPTAVRVANRSIEPARTVAGAVGAEVVAWKDRYAALAGADVVIVASGAPDPVLRAERMPSRAQGHPAALLIDIGVPRNIDPSVGVLPGYDVLDLDALQDRMVVVQARRSEEIPAARAICETHLAEFVSWFFHHLALQPAIHAIRETFDRIRRQEIERHQYRFSEADLCELDRLTQSILQKVLAVPVVRLKNTGPESLDYVRGIRLLRDLFTRPDCEDGPDEHDADPLVQAASPVSSAIADTEGCPFEQPQRAEVLRDDAERAHPRRVPGGTEG